MINFLRHKKEHVTTVSFLYQNTKWRDKPQSEKIMCNKNKWKN